MAYSFNNSMKFFSFFFICWIQFNVTSKVNPKYLTVLLRGILFWLVFTSEQIYFLRINVMGDNLDSFILIFYLLNQVTSKFRWCCRLEGAPTGFPWVAKMAVPSRNVLVVVIGKVGINMMLVCFPGVHLIVLVVFLRYLCELLLLIDFSRLK